MPAPQKSLFVQLAKINFLSKGIQLPTSWVQPGTQYPSSFSPKERIVTPNSPMNLFREASLNKYHVDSAKTIGDQFAAYIDGICGAICDGIDKWMKTAMIAGVVINGPVGMLLPGGVMGPPLMPLILATAPKKTPQELKYSIAIANAFGVLWLPWHMGLMGMLTYPAFAAFPGPMAPPMPNIPVPLIAFSSPGESGLSPGNLKNLMYGMLADPQALHAMDLFDSIANAFGVVFPIFKATTLVQNVLGMGPIPTFAPPFVPVGPVLGGTVIPTPGILM
jgi:hypothetical protein